MREECVIQICEFARRHRSERERTPQQLYDATDYSVHHAEITQNDIEQVIQADSSLIRDWISFTDDKRWTPAWGLGKRDDKTWLVFYMLRSGKFGYEITFASAVPACALMIRMEMEEFRRIEREKP